MSRDQPEGRTLPQGQSPTASVFTLDLHFKSKLGKACCRCLFLMQEHVDAPGWGGSMELPSSYIARVLVMSGAWKSPQGGFAASPGLLSANTSKCSGSESLFLQVGFRIVLCGQM